MSLKHTHIIIVSVSLIMVFLSSCAKLKRLVIADDAETVLKSELRINYESKIIPQYIFIENASIKIEGEVTNRAKVNFYLEKDQMIFISVKLLGFEMLRFQLTKDSVKYINRINREYYFGSLNNDQEDLTGLLNFVELENLVTTGFILKEDGGFDNFLSNSTIGADGILFSEELGPGQNVLCNYSLAGLKIFDLAYLDYVKQIETKIIFDRGEFNLNSIHGFYKNREYTVKFYLDINEIKNERFSKTDFRIGRNYNEIESLL